MEAGVHEDAVSSASQGNYPCGGFCFLSAWQEIFGKGGRQLGKEKGMHAHGSFLRVVAMGKVGRGCGN